LFLSEARRALAEADAELAERDDADPRELLRAFHTLKGMSATMEHGALVAIAHALEDVCEVFARDGRPLDVATIALLVDAVGHLRAQLAEVESGREPPDAEALERRIRRHLSERAHTGFRLLVEEDPTPPPADVDSAGEDAAAALADMLAACRRLRELADDTPAVAAEIHRLEAGARRMYHRLAELREVPFETVLPPLRRRLRALCRELGREASLEVEGEDVRVDPEVLGPLQTALVQLLHNALAHGIERPEERGAKSAVGRISLGVERVGKRLHVRFADDGRGLDLVRLRAVAGDPTADALALALRPGISTASDPGVVAGRGHGLPAVWHLLSGLGGEVHLESSSAGTRLHIEVPLHAELTPLLLVRAAGQTLALLARRAATGPEDAGAAPLFALQVAGAASVDLAGGARVRVDHVLGAFEAPVARPPWPLHALPHLVGTTVAPEGHILLVVDPTSALLPRGTS